MHGQSPKAFIYKFRPQRVRQKLESPRAPSTRLDASEIVDLQRAISKCLNEHITTRVLKSTRVLQATTAGTLLSQPGVSSLPTRATLQGASGPTKQSRFRLFSGPLSSGTENFPRPTRVSKAIEIEMKIAWLGLFLRHRLVMGPVGAGSHSSQPTKSFLPGEERGRLKGKERDVRRFAKSSCLSGVKTLREKESRKRRPSWATS